VGRKFFVTSVWNWLHSIRSSTVATIPFHSLDVSLFRTVTLGTIGLGAAVLATHAGVGFGGFFGGIVEASRDGWKGVQVVVVRRYTPSPITQGR
jgi:hypothetical protein